MTTYGLTPILNVSSLPESFAWFAHLGWERRWDYGDPPTFGAVGSGPVEVFLCQDDQGGRGEHGTWMSVWVDDVDAVYAVALAHGLDVPMPPTDEPWGVREMHLRNPDGHMFRISRGEEPHEHPHDHPHPH